jgi:hypothetical protein
MSISTTLLIGEIKAFRAENEVDILAGGALYIDDCR